MGSTDRLSAPILLARCVLVALVSVVLAGCGSRHAGPERWPGPPRSAGAHLDVSGFNDFVARVKPEAARSPLTAAAEFLRLDRSNAQTTSVVSRRSGEGGGPATVVATLDRLPDDSVRALRYVLVFEHRAGGTWRLRSAARSQRCWPHRGHQGFSPAPCA